MGITLRAVTMRKRYVVFHGIGTNGDPNINKVGEGLSRQGHFVSDPDLPIRSWWSANFTVKQDAKHALKSVREGDALICHSHGSNIGLEVAKHVPVRAVFLFNPAAPANFDFSELKGQPEITCIFSNSDWIVWVGSILPLHVFGRAGVSGFRQLDDPDNPYGRNIDTSGSDHNDAFAPPGLWYWTNEISEHV